MFIEQAKHGLKIGLDYHNHAVYSTMPCMGGPIIDPKCAPQPGRS